MQRMERLCVIHGNCSCPFSLVRLKKQNHFNLPLPHHLTQRIYLATLVMFKENTIQRSRKLQNWITVILIIQNQLDVPHCIQLLENLSHWKKATKTPPKRAFPPSRSLTVCFFPTEPFHPMESMSRLENAVTRSWTVKGCRTVVPNRRIRERYLFSRVPVTSHIFWIVRLSYMVEVCHLEVFVQFSKVYVTVFVMYTILCIEIILPQVSGVSSGGFTAQNCERFKILSRLWLQIQINDMQIALIFFCLHDMLVYCPSRFCHFVACQPSTPSKNTRPSDLRIDFQNDCQNQESCP